MSSVRLSVSNALHFGAEGLYYEVKSCTFVFLARHFLFTSSDTFVIGCIV